MRVLQRLSTSLVSGARRSGVLTTSSHATIVRERESPAPTDVGGEHTLVRDGAAQLLCRARKAAGLSASLLIGLAIGWLVDWAVSAYVHAIASPALSIPDAILNSLGQGPVLQPSDALLTNYGIAGRPLAELAEVAGPAAKFAAVLSMLVGTVVGFARSSAMPALIGVVSMLVLTVGNQVLLPPLLGPTSHQPVTLSQVLKNEDWSNAKGLLSSPEMPNLDATAYLRLVVAQKVGDKAAVLALAPQVRKQSDEGKIAIPSSSMYALDMASAGAPVAMASKEFARSIERAADFSRGVGTAVTIGTFSVFPVVLVLGLFASNAFLRVRRIARLLERAERGTQKASPR